MATKIKTLALARARAKMRGVPAVERGSALCAQRRLESRWLWVSAALAAACSTVTPDSRGAKGEIGVFVADAAVPPPALAPSATSVPVVSDNSLRARIENISGLTLSVLTSGCAGSCAEITAAAHGGNPPYVYRWDDGSTSKTRRVCPQTDGILTVSVSDTEIVDAEFGYTPQTATATITSDVIECSLPDAGSGEPDAGRDAGAAPVCRTVTVAPDVANGCRRLPPSATCPVTFGRNPSRTYELPYPVNTAGPHCLVALGNTHNGTSASLDLHIASAEVSCVGEQQLHDPHADPVAPNVGSTGQSICLLPTMRPYQKITVAFESSEGSWEDLDLRLCEECPM